MATFGDAPAVFGQAVFGQTLFGDFSGGGTATVTAGPSWWGLVDVWREADGLARAERSAPLQACPNDGEPLLVGPGGVNYCPFDGWRSV